MTLDALVAQIQAKAQTAGAKRFLLALAGPPASGKSTLAAELAERLSPGARVVPMDGFHYDDRVLRARGLLSRKGAPNTFDVAGLAHLLTRLQNEDEVAIPLFDRDLEISRAGADIVTPNDKILIVEGNYLLLDAKPWTDLRQAFDLTVKVDVPEDELKRRLLARWLGHGKTQEQALAWIEGNDLPNALTVLAQSGPADIVLRNS